KSKRINKQTMQQTIKQELLNTRRAKKSLSGLDRSVKQHILNLLAMALQMHVDEILTENEKDLVRMDPADSKYDRLKLTPERIEGLAQSVVDVSQLDDPTNQLISSRKLANGLLVEKRTVALGVVGVIYEARPNVTIDVAALCIQSGNVCLLRGGSDAWFTNSYLVSLIRDVLLEVGADPNIVQLLPTDRELVSDLLTATDFVDIIIPRGSQS